MRNLSFILAMVLSLGLIGNASAQTMSDDDYITKGFGTTAVFKTATQVVDPNTGWWGDKLPQELSGNQGYLIGVVNSRRMDKGFKPLLNPNDYLISLGYEEVVDGGFTYFIDFTSMRPSEVEMIFELLGGKSALLPGAEVSYRALTVRSIYATADASGMVNLAIGDQTISFKVGTAVGDVRAQVAAALKKMLGLDAPFDLYCNQYSYNDGTFGGDASVYVDLSGKTLYNGSYSGEGGM
jgi:hypothetical protein